MTQTQEEIQNNPTDTNSPYQIDDHMHDLNASLERLSVTGKPLTGNTSDTDLNSLANMHGFASFQLVFGQNP